MRLCAYGRAHIMLCPATDLRFGSNNRLIRPRYNTSLTNKQSEEGCSKHRGNYGEEVG